MGMEFFNGKNVTISRISIYAVMGWGGGYLKPSLLFL